MAPADEKPHTIDEIEALPEGIRAELIDGQIRYMAAPASIHARLISRIDHMLESYIDQHGGTCKVGLVRKVPSKKPHLARSKAVDT